jgi:hypothetical protein
MPHEPGSPGWKPLTGLDEAGAAGGRLLGALITTFEPPEPRALIEDYLPVWLGLDNSYADEGSDRLRYFAELEEALRRLKGNFAILSSAGEAATSVEAWIWNYIHRFEVGALRAAVQHAKLWMFHRASPSAANPETLELVVSSANLTRGGLRGQIQAGWRCVLPLDGRGSDSRMETWGILPTFLVELGKASGRGGPAMIDGWLALLRRCLCPANVDFIASVPGVYSARTLASRRSAWGAAGLRAAWSGRNSHKLVIMAPTIGRWTADSIEAWAKLAGTKPGRISIAWLREGHPWAVEWQLDPSSEAALTRSGICWLEVPVPHDADWGSPLCEEHQQQTDTRWSHAKLYELCDGPRRRLLITSANLSRAAWGAPQSNGGLIIDNFEIGVLVRVRDSLSLRLRKGSYQRATREIDYAQPREAPIAWLAAEWDGHDLSVECRPNSTRVEFATHVAVTVARDNSGKRILVKWSRDSVVRTNVPWPPGKGVPILMAVETTEGDVRTTAVHDVRMIDDESILYGEFDENLLREMLDRLLEEKYGYLPAQESAVTTANTKKGRANVATGANYAVPAYVDARRRFQLVDNWWKKLCDADERSRLFILKDGQRICERWSAAAKAAVDREIRLPASIAAEELALRIRKFK